MITTEQFKKLVAKIHDLTKTHKKNCHNEVDNFVHLIRMRAYMEILNLLDDAVLDSRDEKNGQ